MTEPTTEPEAPEVPTEDVPTPAPEVDPDDTQPDLEAVPAETEVTPDAPTQE